MIVSFESVAAASALRLQSTAPHPRLAWLLQAIRPKPNLCQIQRHTLLLLGLNRAQPADAEHSRLQFRGLPAYLPQHGEPIIVAGPATLCTPGSAWRASISTFPSKSQAHVSCLRHGP